MLTAFDNYQSILKAKNKFCFVKITIFMVYNLFLYDISKSAGINYKKWKSENMLNYILHRPRLAKILRPSSVNADDDIIYFLIGIQHKLVHFLS